MKKEISRLQQSRRRTQYEFPRQFAESGSVAFRLPVKRQDVKSVPLVHLKKWELQHRDERSLSVSILDHDRIKLVNHLQDAERSTDGFERIRRIKTGKDTPLCVDAFLTIWENPGFFPSDWAKAHEGNQLKHIFFDGAILTSSLFTEPFTPYLVATSEGLGYGFYPLYLPRHAQDLTAVV